MFLFSCQLLLTFGHLEFLPLSPSPHQHLCKVGQTPQIPLPCIIKISKHILSTVKTCVENFMDNKLDTDAGKLKTPSILPKALQALQSSKSALHLKELKELRVLTFKSWASLVVLVVKNPSANTGNVREVGLIPGLWRSPGGGHGNPL